MLCIFFSLLPGNVLSCMPYVPCASTWPASRVVLPVVRIPAPGMLRRLAVRKARRRQPAGYDKPVTGP
ncbi:hypothetical protein BKK79_04325 [Cupriavidus sp. USMAA2-4]|nr:hypothetical protein BKK79_04325 [Cupriavidus sp. USMAA2-4]